MKHSVLYAAVVALVGACSDDSFTQTSSATTGTATTGSTGGAGVAGATVGSGGATDGGGGLGASGGTGGALVCEPGSMAECYTGPAGTQDVGPCKAGSQVCDAEGMGYGPCVGEDLPAPAEDCATPIDDDCSGSSNDVCACIPGNVQGCYSGPNGTENVGPCVGGTETCDMEGLGYGPCTGEILPVVEDCVNLVDDDCEGGIDEAADGCVCHPPETQPCYTGPAGTQNVGVCIGGVSSCNADGKGFGAACAGQVLPGAEVCHNVVDEDCNGASCAAPIFAKLFGAGGTQTATSVAFDQAGNIYLVGTYEQTLDLGGGVTHTSAGLEDVFVLKLSAAGSLVWSKSFGTAGAQKGLDIAATGAHLAIVGSFETGITFGASSYIAGGGVQKGWVAKLTQADGSALWSAEIAVEPTFNTASSVAFDAVGDVVVGGFHKEIGFPENNVLVRKYLGASGAVAWAKTYGDANPQSVSDIATDASSNILVSGSLLGSMTVTPCPAINAGTSSTNGFAFKLQPNGDCVWSSQFGDAPLPQVVTGIATDANSNVLITGTFNGNLGCGGGNLATLGGFDIFACKLAPNGSHVWSKRFGGAPVFEAGGRVAADTSGNMFLFGYYETTITFGGPNLPTTNGGNDLFLAKLDGQGNHLWSKGIVTTPGSFDTGGGLATFQGMSVITGAVAGTIDTGAGPLSSVGGQFDALVAKFAP